MTQRLVVFAPNWLGDAVMALPAIADVHRALPDATIDLAARGSVLPLADLVPGIASGLAVSTRSATVAALKNRHYDAALLLPNSFNTALIARMAGIPERWGYRHEGRGVLLTKAVWAPARVHQVAFYQHLTTHLGFPAGASAPQLDVSESLKHQGSEVLAARGWDGVSPLVAIAPGAAFGSAKRWPADKFAAVINGLAGADTASPSAVGVRVVLVGARADVAAVNEVVRLAADARPINLAGETTLTELAAVLTQCRHLVTNDSGAMHLAAALGIDVTAVFGPTNEEETSPRGSGRLTVIHEDVWCRPCMLRECPLAERCMRLIKSDAVLASVKATL